MEWWIRDLNPGDLTSYNNVFTAIQLQCDKGTGFCTSKALLTVAWSAVHTDSRAPTLRSRHGLRVSISTISHKLPGTSLSTAGPQPASKQPCALVSGRWHCPTAPLPMLRYREKSSKRTKRKKRNSFFSECGRKSLHKEWMKKKCELLLEHINMYAYVSYVLNVFLKNFTKKISFSLIKSYAIFN